MQIQISWLLQKSTDLDLHCLLTQGMSCSAREGLKPKRYFSYFSTKTYVVVLIRSALHFYHIYCIFDSVSGPGCSKLMMSLVNVSLKLSSLNTTYTPNFLLKNMSSFCKSKSYSHFFSKNTCELVIVLIRTVNILTTNKLVKLTML